MDILNNVINNKTLELVNEVVDDTYSYTNDDDKFRPSISERSNQIICINGWSGCLEDSVDQIGAFSVGYEKMLLSESHLIYQTFKKIFKIVTIIPLFIIFLGLLSLFYVSEAFGLLSAALAALVSYFNQHLRTVKYESQVAKYRRIASNYGGLARSIDRQLALPPEQRQYGVNFHEWISSSYERLSAEPLHISQDVILSYNQDAEEQNLPTSGRTQEKSIFFKVKRLKSGIPTYIPECMPKKKNIPIETVTAPKKRDPRRSHSIQYDDSADISLQYELQRFNHNKT
jgi:hypothetical protein